MTRGERGEPATGAVRTVLGDVAPAELGRTYAHEHLVLHNALIAAAFPHILLDDVDLAVAEVRDCVTAGVGTMVDAMPCASGRDVRRLAEVSHRTGVHILSVTGLHHPRYYGPDHWTARIGPEVLTALFVDDLLTGIDEFDYTGPAVHRTPHRAGAIKIATGGTRLNPRDRLLIAAAAAAHRSTGAPVLTHCEGGTGALEQVEALGRAGVPADAVLLSHIDKVTDAGYHRELAASGAWLLYDQALRQHREARPRTAHLVLAAAEQGYLGQVLLGTDGARRDLWRAYGGTPGLAWLGAGFTARLAAMGLTEPHLAALLVDNPGRAFAWRPPTAVPPDAGDRPVADRLSDADASRGASENESSGSGYYGSQDATTRTS